VQEKGEKKEEAYDPFYQLSPAQRGAARRRKIPLDFGRSRLRKCLPEIYRERNAVARNPERFMQMYDKT